MKLNYIVAGLMMATTAAADIPFVIDDAASFHFSGTIQRNGETICDIALNYEHTLPDFPPQKHETGCSLDLSDLSDIQISGEYNGNHSSGSFDETFTLFDISPWTAVLRDESLDLGTRLERYIDSIGQFDAQFMDGITIRKIDAPEDARRALKAEIGGDIPAELEMLITHDIAFYDSNYIGPAYRRRRSEDAPVTWPTLIEIERENGYRENELPQEGSERRAWYERVRVVYENEGDGYAHFVWDPAAAAGEAQFFWLEEDTREVEPFVHLDGTPVNPLNTLLTPFMRDGLPEAVFTENGLDAYDPNLIIVDTSNPDGMLSVYFRQGSNIPLFRKVIPDMTFYNQTWWPR